MNIIKKIHEMDKYTKEDLKISIFVGSVPLSWYAAIIAGCATRAYLGLPVSFEGAGEALALMTAMGVGLGTFCFYNRRDTRKLNKELLESGSKKHE